MHPKVLTPQVAALIRAHGPALCPDGYLLAGGTALALYLGHRESVDLDFMTMAPPKDMKAFDDHIADRFPQAMLIDDTGRSRHYFMDGVKVSYLWQPGIRLEVGEAFQGLQLASIPTLAVLKCNAVVNRGSRKDFYDLFALGQAGWALPRLLNAAEDQAPRLSDAVIVRSLTYFDGATRDTDAPVRSLTQTPWHEVTRYWRNTVFDYLRSQTRTHGR